MQNEQSAFEFSIPLPLPVPAYSYSNAESSGLSIHQQEKITWNGSENDESFQRIEQVIRDERFDTLRQTKESEIVVVHVVTRQLNSNLQKQRAYLQEQFNQSLDKDIDSTARAVKKISEYREIFYKRANFPTLSANLEGIYNQEAEDEIKFYSSFFERTNTSLVVPILTRFWIEGTKRRNHSDYRDALKALASFYVLRRASVPDTDTLQEQFRQLMNGVGAYPGLKHENPLVI